MEEAQKQEEFGCETCKMRLKAEEKPRSISAWFWRLHTKFCPGWKAYQKHLSELEQ